jgi:SnoaL-like domain
MTTDTSTTPAIDISSIDTYLAAWNERDDTARAELVEASLGADLWYRDPVLEADGRDAFAAALGAVQQQFPGFVMRRTSAVDGHHDIVRFNWAFGAPGGLPALAGVDVAELDADGRLHRIIGFAGETIA